MNLNIYEIKQSLIEKWDEANRKHAQNTCRNIEEKLIIIDELHEETKHSPLPLETLEEIVNDILG